jgi:hypothetical protein
VVADGLVPVKLHRQAERGSQVNPQLLQIQGRCIWPLGCWYVHEVLPMTMPDRAAGSNPQFVESKVQNDTFQLQVPAAPTQFKYPLAG